MELVLFLLGWVVAAAGIWSLSKGEAAKHWLPLAQVLFLAGLILVIRAVTL